MSYYYRIKKKSYIKNGAREEKYFAVPKTKGTLELEDIAKEISGRSIAKESAVIAVLKELSILMKHDLVNGYNIKFDGIGTFGVAITSEGFDKPDDITARDVEYSKVTYRPDSDLVRLLKDMKYTKEPPAPKGCVTKEEFRQVREANKRKKLEEIEDKKNNKRLK
ncbi:MAG: HU family DNA-binding protein [Bacteroidales bacterium]|jgi:predicted histone-like DNA-binding protein